MAYLPGGPACLVGGGEGGDRLQYTKNYKDHDH